MKHNDKTSKEFSKIRSILFPIHKEELRKFIPLTLIFFFISLNYSALRNLKDIFLLNTAGGAESIYYIKLFGVLPTVILYTIIYGKISRTFGRDGRFNILVSSFLVFYALFLFILFPNIDSFTLDAFANRMNIRYVNFKGLWEAIRYWPFSLFYINAEAWGTFCLSVLFWTFANEITSVKQSKRFYSFLAIGANVGLIIAGTFLKAFGSRYDLMLWLILFLGILLLAIYNIFSKDITKNPTYYQIETKKKKKKVKMSFKESFAFLIKSRYLALIAILVMSYGMVISFFESVWKSQIKKLFSQMGNNKNLLANIYANQSILIGITTVLMIFFLSAPIMKKGWRFAASLTPIIAALLSILFFVFLFFDTHFVGLADSFGTTSLFIAVIFGLINVVFIKSSKYTLFDPTKEATYIPLDETSKIQGKAAVDGVGGRLGKSLGSLILTFGLMPLGGGEIDNVKQYIIFFILTIIIVWIIAVKNLGIRFENLTQEEKDKK